MAYRAASPSCHGDEGMVNVHGVNDINRHVNGMVNGMLMDVNGMVQVRLTHDSEMWLSTTAVDG